MYEPNVTTLLIVGCWLIWGAYWIANWSRSKATAVQQNVGARLAYRVPTVIAYVLLMSDLHFVPIVRLVCLPHSPITAAIGSFFCVAGTAISIAARKILDTNWSADVVLKEGHTLVDAGPYRLVRHPIYTGMLMMFLGTAVVRGLLGPLIAVPIAVFAFWIKASQEETLLLRQFPTMYLDYQSRTKRLIPYIL